jgi:hypothetical protein
MTEEIKTIDPSFSIARFATGKPKWSTDFLDQLVRS